MSPDVAQYSGTVLGSGMYTDPRGRAERENTEYLVTDWSRTLARVAAGEVRMTADLLLARIEFANTVVQNIYDVSSLEPISPEILATVTGEQMGRAMKLRKYFRSTRELIVLNLHNPKVTHPFPVPSAQLQALLNIQRSVKSAFVNKVVLRVQAYNEYLNGIDMMSLMSYFTHPVAPGAQARVINYEELISLQTKLSSATALQQVWLEMVYLLNQAYADLEVMGTYYGIDVSLLLK